MAHSSRPGCGVPVYEAIVCGRDVQTVNPVHVLWTEFALYVPRSHVVDINHFAPLIALRVGLADVGETEGQTTDCLLYTSDAADE